jgi:hypothetical protein
MQVTQRAGLMQAVVDRLAAHARSTSPQQRQQAWVHDSP